MKPWIGVDLDGTLAEYDGFKGLDQIGAIVEPMKKRILEWLEFGYEVKVFTARIAEDPVMATWVVQEWLAANGLPRLEVTNVKDHYMVELYDDRAVQVKFNTGEIVGYSTREYRRLQP